MFGDEMIFCFIGMVGFVEGWMCVWVSYGIVFWVLNFNEFFFLFVGDLNFVFEMSEGFEIGLL